MWGCTQVHLTRSLGSAERSVKPESTPEESESGGHILLSLQIFPSLFISIFICLFLSFLVSQSFNVHAKQQSHALPKKLAKKK